MPVDFGAGREGNFAKANLVGGVLGKLRASAALAAILAISAPAFAQSAPEAAPETRITEVPAEPAPAAADDDEQQASHREGERVYVFGRRIQSSVPLAGEDPPQVVNVISSETLQEQGVASLEQALRNVPGITTQIGEGGQMNGDQFFIRGFAAKDDIYTDGLRDFGVFTRDSFNYGQVEVLKGPSSTLLGRGTTGGGINTSSKTPFLDDSASATLAAGSADYVRATADYNKQFGEGMAIRLNAMAHHQGVEGRDVIETDRWGFAPSIGFGLNGPTSLTVSALVQHDNRIPDYGIPFVQIPSNRPPAEPTRTVAVPYTNFGVKSSNFYGYDADTDETRVYTVTAKFRHEVNDALALTSDTKFGNYYRYFRQTVPNACNGACATAFLDNNPATIPLVNMGGPGPYEQTTLGIQNVTIASITAPLFDMKNEAMIGTDASWQTNDRDQFNYYPAGDPRTRAPKDVFNPAHSPSPQLTAILNNTRKSTATDFSLFLSDRLWLNPQWSVKLGVRAQWYQFSQDQTTFTASTTNPDVLASSALAALDSSSDFVSPSVSLIWEPAASTMVYASYATSATPPGITVSNGSTISATTKDLDPEENTSVELGVRTELIPEKVVLQAAVFDVKKNNSKIFDANGDLAATSGDSQEAKGVEIGLAGNLTRVWGYNFTYAYSDVETTESSNPGNVGKKAIYVPEHAASLWTTYNFEDALAGLQVGLGVTYQDRILVQNTGYNPGNPLATPAVAPTAAAYSQVPSYVTFDAMASYGWDRWRLSLNAYNLADQLYFSQVNSNRAVPAPGRYVIATLGVVY